MSRLTRASVALFTAATLLVGAPLALGKAVDDLGVHAQFGWEDLVGKAHARDPKLAMFWPHPTGRSHGQDAVKDELADGGDTFPCADSVERYTEDYRTWPYQQYLAGKRSTPPVGSFYVDVSNSTEVCTDLLEIVSPSSFESVEKGFTPTGHVTIHLSRHVGKHDVPYSVKATEYTDTATYPADIVGLSDCYLVFALDGTTLTVHASRSNSEYLGTAAVSCAKAVSFADRMHRLRYVKG